MHVETAVDKATHTIKNTLVELRAERAQHVAAIAQLDGLISKLDGIFPGEASVPVPAVPPVAASSSAPPRKRSHRAAAKPAGKAAAKPAPKTAAPKTGAQVATKPGVKAAAKAAVPKNGAPPKAKPAAAPKLEPTTAISAAGLSPRVVKFCHGAHIQTIADLGTRDLRSLAKTSKRIGESAIQEMFGALKRAGLKPLGTVPVLAAGPAPVTAPAAVNGVAAHA